jgi:chemotaxis protein histidine kinase CheA
MSAESPAATPVTERYLKLSKAYVKLASRYANLDVEHGKLKRILIKLLLSYRDLKKELADAHEKIQSIEGQNQQLQQFQALLEDEFISALEEAEQAEANCERLLSQKDQDLDHLALEVDEAVKQLEANLPIDVVGTEQPMLEEARVEAEEPSVLEVTSETLAETEIPETAEEPIAAVVSAESAVPEAEEPIYEVVQEAAPIPTEVAEEEPVYEVAQGPITVDPALSDTEEELMYEVAQEELVYAVATEAVQAPVAAEAPAQVAVTAQEPKPQEPEKSVTPASTSPSDDWDLALGFFDVA